MGSRCRWLLGTVLAVSLFAGPVEAAERVIMLRNGVDGYVGQADVSLGVPKSYGYDDAGRGKWKGALLLGRALVRFDLAGVPRNASVREATLELYCTRLEPKGESVVTVGLAPVLKPWVTDKVGWTSTGTGANWAYPGLLPGADWRTSFLQIVSPVMRPADAWHVVREVAGQEQWIAWDVTEVVRDWLARPADNHGLYVAAHQQRPRVHVVSSDGRDVQLRPRLVIRVDESAPRADAGPDILRAELGTPLILNGTGSTGGTPPLQFTWRLVEKPWYSKLTEPDLRERWKAEASFSPDAVGFHRLELRVTDALGRSDVDTVRVSACRMNPRPRIELGEGVRERLKEFIAKNPGDETWTRTRDDVLRWQLVGDRAAGRRAVEAAVRQARTWNADPPPPSTKFYHTRTAQPLARVLDWCCDLMTPEERAEIVRAGNNAAWGCLTGWQGSFRGGDTLYNHFTTRLMGALMWGVAAWGDDPEAAIFVENAQVLLRRVMVQEYAPWVSGGAMWEGGDYGWADFRHSLVMMSLLRSATGEDLTRRIDLSDRIPFFIHATRPTGTSCYFQGHAWSNNDVPGTMHRRYREPMVLFANMYPETGAYVPLFLARTRLSRQETGVQELLLKVNFPEPKDHETDWPTSWHAPSLGVVLARSRWGDPDATHLSFICGPYIHYYSDQDQGHFEIFRRRRLVIDQRERDGGGDSTYPSWRHNTLVVGELGEQEGHSWYDGPMRGGQRTVERRVGAGGKIIALEDDHLNFLSVCGDLRGAYLADRVKAVTRHIVFLRPDHVVVFDRIVSPDDTWRHRFFLWLWDKPEVAGGLSVASNADARIFCRTLLPAEPRITVVGPGPHGEGGRRHSYHIEVEGKDKSQETRFLHLLTAAVGDDARAPEATLVTGPGFEGVRFSDGGREYQVIFRPAAPGTGQVRITEAGRLVTLRELSGRVVPPPRQLPPHLRGKPVAE